jgi:hypothetical protein
VISLSDTVIALSAGFVASAINTVAGGGSLISFPVLNVGFALPSVVANATNSASLWPGSLAGGLGFANLFQKTKHHLFALLPATLLGSIVGAILLLNTSSKVFDRLVPPLIFLAALLLAFQPRIKAWSLQRHGGVPKPMGQAIQFLVSVYGGYFGAGMGIMMLAAFSLYVDGDIHELNSLKSWLGLLINLTAAIVFVIQRTVVFAFAAPMVIGAILGGYVAARLSQKVNTNVLRICISSYGFAAAGYFVWRLVVRH